MITPINFNSMAYMTSFAGKPEDPASKDKKWACETLLYDKGITEVDMIKAKLARISLWEDACKDAEIILSEISQPKTEQEREKFKERLPQLAVEILIARYELRKREEQMHQRELDRLYEERTREIIANREYLKQKHMESLKPQSK